MEEGVAVSKVTIFNRYDGNEYHSSLVSSSLSDSVVFFLNVNGATLKAFRIGDATDIPVFDIFFDPANSTISTCALDLVDTCGATLDIWTGIIGNSISDLMYGTNYLTSVPSRSTHLTELLEIPNTGDNYGCRIRGWLKPPTTGDYTFWIASDAEGELWLSTDSSSMNKVLICHSLMQQKSPGISLVAGQAYYYEVRGCGLMV